MSTHHGHHLTHWRMPGQFWDPVHLCWCRATKSRRPTLGALKLVHRQTQTEILIQCARKHTGSQCRYGQIICYMGVKNVIWTWRLFLYFTQKFSRNLYDHRPIVTSCHCILRLADQNSLNRWLSLHLRQTRGSHFHLFIHTFISKFI